MDHSNPAASRSPPPQSTCSAALRHRPSPQRCPQSEALTGSSLPPPEHVAYRPKLESGRIRQERFEKRIHRRRQIQILASGFVVDHQGGNGVFLQLLPLKTSGISDLGRGNFPFHTECRGGGDRFPELPHQFALIEIGRARLTPTGLI